MNLKNTPILLFNYEKNEINVLKEIIGCQVFISTLILKFFGAILTMHIVDFQKDGAFQFVHQNTY